MTLVDNWGGPLAADSTESLTAWNSAWSSFFHFVGDPIAQLAEANASDQSFALGSVLCATYRVLAGVPLDSPELLVDVERAKARASTTRDVGHAEALTHLARGDFSQAAVKWDDIANSEPDMAAVRFAHDTYLHVADADRRFSSSARAMQMFSDSPAWNLIAGQYSFSLEECGKYEEAERVGWMALEADPLDLWALHALAHVYESTNNQKAALELLRGREDTWRTQDSLAVHIWWHLALRLIAGGYLDEALSIHDELVADATTPFRMSDLVSLLWRLELAGLDVGDRWDHLADAFSVRPERHTAAFLDMHQAMIYTRRPHHPSAGEFFGGVVTSHRGTSENDRIFRTVAAPLCEAIRVSSSDPAKAAELIDSIDAQLHRIGGSDAQRDIIALTRTSLIRSDAEDL